MTDVAPGLLAQVLSALGLAPEQVRLARWLDNGPHWLGLLLDQADTVRALRPDHAALKSLGKVGVIAPQTAGADTDFEVRGFVAPIGVNEDPVTGSLNASLAQWLVGEGLAPEHYVAAQGSQLGRAGRVHVSQDGDTFWIGGNVATVIQGTATL